MCERCWKVISRREIAERTLFPKTYFGQRDAKSIFSVTPGAATVPGPHVRTPCPAIVHVTEWPQNCLLGHVCPRESDADDDRARLFP